MGDLTEQSIVEVGSLLAERRVSASELLTATLERIQATEPMVHAYATVMTDSAQRAARRADAELFAGLSRSPLHGVPVAVKDLCYTVDAPTEAGSRVLEGFVPEYDATVVRKLRDAGAVIVGKTITHEFAYGQNVPPTRNPWDLRCYPGGSSAGSGVAVAVGSAFAAIGSDTGGSIRIPAAVNGVVGIKPTYGQVSRHGVIPMSASLDCAGPLARTSEDAAIVLEAISGPDPFDATTRKHEAFNRLTSFPGDVKGLRIGVEAQYFQYRGVISEVRQSFAAALHVLAEHGVEVIDVTIPYLDMTVPAALTILIADTSSYHRKMLRGRADKYEPGTRVMLEVGELLPASHYILAQKARTLIRNAVRDAFDHWQLDAIASPTLPIPTIPVDELSVAVVGETGESALSAYVHNTFTANLTGQPAITIPSGFTQSGLPIGLQFMGRPFAEATLLRLCRAYEASRHWESRFPTLEA